MAVNREKRGATPGGTPPESRPSTITIRRTQAGAWLGYVGGAALIAAMLAALGVGLSSPVTLGLLAAGLAGLAAWAALAPGDVRGLVTGRGVRYGTVAVFSTLLLVGIVVLVYGLLARNALVLDMTEGQRFTLSPETRRVLARVTQPMQITAFYTSAELPVRARDDQFYQLYPASTDGLIRLVYYNPDELPNLAEQFGVTGSDRVFISYLNAAGEVDFTTLARVPISERQERDMTSAVARLLIAGRIAVYFETSHGGRDPFDTAQDGISGINAGMRESGLRTYGLSLAELAQTGSDVPDDAGAIIFARPLSDLAPDEVAVIDRYLTRGGSLFIMADVTFADDAFMREDGPFNRYLWENYGVRARDAAVVDFAASGQTALDVFSAYVFSENDITGRVNPAEGSPTVFRLARAVEVNLDAAPPNIAVGRLILSSEQSYGERDLAALGATNTYTYEADTDTPGPLDLAVFANDRETDARIVLVGDSDFVTNGQVNNGGNAVFFTDAVAWLTRLNEELEYAPQAFSAGLPLLYLDPAGFNLIAVAVAVVLPGAVALAGVVIGARRARRSRR